MKLKLAMLLTLALTTLVASAASLDDYKLKIDDKEYGYLFADQTLVEAQKEEILKDLHTLLISMKPKSVYRLAPKDDTDETILTINGVGYRYEFAIEFGNAVFEGSELIWEELGTVATSKDNADYILVSTELSNAYKKAFEFVKQHEKAYKQLSAFIKMLNEPDIKTLPPLADLLYLFGGSEEDQRDIAERGQKKGAREDFIEVLKSQKFVLGSILENTIIENHPAAHVWVSYITNKWTPSKDTFIFDKGRWKILVPIGL